MPYLWKLPVSRLQATTLLLVVKPKGEPVPPYTTITPLNIRADVKEGFFGFFLFMYDIHYSILLHLPALRFNCVGRMMGSNPGQLRLRHWLSNALTTRLCIIHTRLYLIHTRLYLIHTRLYLIHTWLYLIHTRLYLIHSWLRYFSSTLGYISFTRQYLSRAVVFLLDPIMPGRKETIW